MKKLLTLFSILLFVGCYSPQEFDYRDTPTYVLEKAKDAFSQDSTLYATVIEYNHKLYTVDRNLFIHTKTGTKIPTFNSVLLLVVIV